MKILVKSAKHSVKTKVSGTLIVAINNGKLFLTHKTLIDKGIDPTDLTGKTLDVEYYKKGEQLPGMHLWVKEDNQIVKDFKLI